MELCKRYKEIEGPLLDYWPLEQRIQTLLADAKKDRLLEVAVGLGPTDGSAINAPHASRPAVQSGTKLSWIHNYSRVCNAVEAKEQQASEELSECLEKQAGIRLMVKQADLNQREMLYVELHYYQGKPVKVVGSREYMNLSQSSLGRIRLQILKKIYTFQQNCTAG